MKGRHIQPQHVFSLGTYGLFICNWLRFYFFFQTSVKPLTQLNANFSFGSPNFLVSGENVIEVIRLFYEDINSSVILNLNKS